MGALRYSIMWYLLDNKLVITLCPEECSLIALTFFFWSLLMLLQSLLLFISSYPFSY